jgi:soluble lytic murein transglycosylase-like protein
LPQMQMPMEAPGGDAIMQAAMQKKAQKDQYAAHLQAKNDMEQQQAQAIVGHETELSDDPQVQAMLKSGNPQLVDYAMKIAEDEKQKKIASQYNENATFALYDKLIQENTPESLAKAARIMEFKKAGGTQISIGDKFSDIGRKKLTDGQLQEAGMVPGTVAFYDKDGIPKPIDVSNTEAEGKAALHANALDSASNGYMEVLNKVTASPDMNKNSFLSDIHSLNIPGVSNIALQNMSPDFQELDARRALMIQGIEKEFSGAAGTKKEDVDYAISLVPNPHAAKAVQEATYKRLQETIQAMRSKAGTAYTKMQQPNGNKYDDIINAAATKYGIDPDLIRAQIHQESGSNPNAVSPKGASGLMQLMPSTAKQLGVTDVKDPVQNIYGGAQYIKEQLTKYGNAPEALAAYNAGPGAVDKYGGIPPYKETQDYVSNTMDNYAGSKADVAKKQAEYAASHPLVKKIFNQSPDGKAKNDARIAALQERAKKLGIQ